MKIHIGCGSRDFGKDWVHIDGGDFEHVQYNDITDLSQFEPNSVDLIYASHVLEYFDRKEVMYVLDNWYSVLKVGGILRLAVPDFEAMAKLYVAGSHSLTAFLGPLYGKMEMNDQTIYHKTTYDFQSIKNILFGRKFTTVRYWNWRETEHSHIDDCSQAYLPHMEKSKGVLISLNVEAIK